jgi:hypothetical protein
MLPSYENFLGDDELDLDGAPIVTPDPANIANADTNAVQIESPDPANIADADTFKELTQNSQVFAMTIPNQLTFFFFFFFFSPFIWMSGYRTPCGTLKQIHVLQY